MTDLNIKREYYKKHFYELAKRILARFPKELKIFQEYWEKNDYRAACSFYYAEMPQEAKGDLTPEEEKIETEFYGLFVN